MIKGLRTIIAGSRFIGTDSAELYDMVVESVANSGFDIGVVLSGTAAGIDRAGEDWAGHNRITLETYPADWSKGKTAGFQRNAIMAEKADALIAIWDGESRGTFDMITQMCKQGGHIYVRRVH